MLTAARTASTKEVRTDAEVSDERNDVSTQHQGGPSPNGMSYLLFPQIVALIVRCRCGSLFHYERHQRGSRPSSAHCAWQFASLGTRSRSWFVEATERSSD